jgi:Right handed beta helix region
MSRVSGVWAVGSRGFGVVVGACVVAAVLALPVTASARVLLVGSYHGIAGGYGSIQSAVDAAAPGDWILIGPGDYKESGNRVPVGAAGDDLSGAAVLVTTADLHIRGMNRNTVMVDGTKTGTPECSSAAADQDSGAMGPDGSPLGRNGLVVYKASGTVVENLSACNFLTGEHGGNAIWWDGGDSTGTQQLGDFWGSYLSATSTFDGGPDGLLGSYGVYASNVYGPGRLTKVYASNMADSGLYVGACPDCNVTLDDTHAENNDVGYSGTNSGGHLVIENSEFDDNQSGVVTNSANDDDAPSPQDGACPNGETGPTGSHSCWLFEHNYVHDNNNANVPNIGLATLAPVGTGVVIAGGRNDTVLHNVITDNGAWGVLTIPFPDIENPPDVANCGGGIQIPLDGLLGAQSFCYFDDFGNEIADNAVNGNGSFGNLTNGDLAEASNPEDPGNCWFGNQRPVGQGQASTSPPLLQLTHGVCGIPNLGAAFVSPLGLNVICDSQFLATLIPGFSCPVVGSLLGLTPSLFDYPRAADIVMPGMPAQPTMRNPCSGAPANPWCTKPTHTRRRA